MALAQRIVALLILMMGWVHAQRAPLSLYPKATLTSEQNTRLIELDTLYKSQVATENELDELGILLLDAQQYKQALSIYEALCKKNPNRFEYQFSKGAAAGLVLGTVPKIRAFPYLTSLKTGFEQAVRLNPSSIAAQRALLSVYVDLPRILGGDLQKAAQICAQIQSISAFEGALAHVWYASKTNQFDLVKKHMQLALNAKEKKITINDSRYEYATIAWLWGGDMDLAMEYYEDFVDHSSRGDLYPAVFAQFRMVEITALKWKEKPLNITKERIVKQFPNIESWIETFDPIGSVIKDVL